MKPSAPFIVHKQISTKPFRTRSRPGALQDMDKFRLLMPPPNSPEVSDTESESSSECQPGPEFDRPPLKIEDIMRALPPSLKSLYGWSDTPDEAPPKVDRVSTKKPARRPARGPQSYPLGLFHSANNEEPKPRRRRDKSLYIGMQAHHPAFAQSLRIALAEAELRRTTDTEAESPPIDLRGRDQISSLSPAFKTFVPRRSKRIAARIEAQNEKTKHLTPTLSPVMLPRRKRVRRGPHGARKPRKPRKPVLDKSKTAPTQSLTSKGRRPRRSARLSKKKL